MILCEDDLNFLADRWIEYQRQHFYAGDPRNVVESDEDSAVSGLVLHMPFDEPEQAWRFIKVAAKRTATNGCWVVLQLGRLKIC
jgi:hypothetical protein